MGISSDLIDKLDNYGISDCCVVATAPQTAPSRQVYQRRRGCATGAPNPNFAHNCCEFDRELRVQRGTGIMELPVVLDSEVRKSARCKVIRTSESDHWRGLLPSARFDAGARRGGFL